MNIEEILLEIKKHLETLQELNNTEILIIPSKYNTKEPQPKVGMIVMVPENRNERGMIPRFRIDVEDLEATRKNKS